jgi:poly(3-hydroxybutyrate) depolymerase
MFNGAPGLFTSRYGITREADSAILLHEMRALYLNLMGWKRAARILDRRTVLSPRYGGKWVMGNANSASGMREYRLWVPSTRDERKPSPLVMMLHGCGQNAKELAAT